MEKARTHAYKTHFEVEGVIETVNKGPDVDKAIQIAYLEGFKAGYEWEGPVIVDYNDNLRKLLVDEELSETQ